MIIFVEITRCSIFSKNSIIIFKHTVAIEFLKLATKYVPNFSYLMNLLVLSFWRLITLSLNPYLLPLTSHNPEIVLIFPMIVYFLLIITWRTLYKIDEQYKFEKAHSRFKVTKKSPELIEAFKWSRRDSNARPSD